MLHLGRVIKTKRKEAKLSREALSKGICSKEYIYLVEKGMRSPSIEITKALGNRLRADLISYINYLDAEDPITVKNIVYDFIDLRLKYNFKELAIKTKYAEQQEDFQKEPYKYEVLFNQIIIKHLNERNMENSVETISQVISTLGGTMAIEEIPDQEANELLIRYYALLCKIYEYEGYLNEEKLLLESLYKWIQPMQDQKSYQILYITVIMSYANSLYKNGDFDLGKSMIENLISFQICRHYTDKLHMSYYLLYLIKEKMGLESTVEFDRAMNLSRGFGRENDLLILTENKYIF